MPNEQTTVPLFTAGEVLTAADMNLSAGTGVPVFSDTTTRDAGFGGAGEKVLAEGQLCYLSDSNIVQYYTGAAWATVGPANAGALTFIKSETIGTGVASVVVSSAFSSTYENYRIIISGGVASGTNAAVLTLGSTATGYYWGLQGADFAGAASANGAANSSSWRALGGTTTSIGGVIDLLAPNLAKATVFTGSYLLAVAGGVMGNTGGYLNDSTQYTAFTITPTGGATLTGGTIRVYGYSNS